MTPEPIFANLTLVLCGLGTLERILTHFQSTTDDLVARSSFSRMTYWVGLVALYFVARFGFVPRLQANQQISWLGLPMPAPSAALAPCAHIFLPSAKLPMG